MMNRRYFLGSALILTALSACGSAPRSQQQPLTQAQDRLALYPNETPELRRKINYWAAHHEVPVDLVHRLAIRESRHRPKARNGPYYGLLQILPATAKTMGYRGTPEGLLDADNNLNYGVKYLRGAYLVADGNHDAAIKWYASGYYYEAKRKGLLQETGLRA
ncbi:MAG: lytic transglycosylase domain-containing protein [Paracoccus sp. (in: a-proteobacteria)]|uniref:lytic transglycosylase domain-containing protein n=1 Tax=Paracoccus sp. TaxID=267 RepID=UPI0026E0073F|nr:lytic transglycosylase domain-containing protein [Paracoccus sp. (in: a-proteobacteria)]MDO5621509.1 lytic transglycosylase domain-containing protein [Paracoccus sp. (in: a-proteobacteria)]